MPGELFDREAELLIDEQIRPHWSQAGAIVFVTFRTKDSIPRDVVQRWERQKSEWLQRLGFPSGSAWRDVLPKLSNRDRHAFQRQFNRCREVCLDNCLGRCVLRRPELAQIVADSLMFFDEKRYRMGDFVIMPNHVHLLVAFKTAESMRVQFDSWLHFTACKINKRLGIEGTRVVDRSAIQGGGGQLGSRSAKEVR